MDAGADLTIRDDDGDTPMGFAILVSNSSLLEYTCMYVLYQSHKLSLLYVLL